MVLNLTRSKVIWPTLFIILSSCVGTIEETPTVQPSVEGSKEKVAFSGVDNCKPIGHDKIDVFFGKASISGDSNQENIVYQIFQDGNFDEAVATAIGSQIPEDENGMYHLMVDDIPKNTEASFVVRAFDSVSGSTDDNYITCLAKTLSTELPDFDGVREVAKFPGIEGRSTLEIFWTKAKPGKTIGTDLPKAGYAISGYKIYFGKDPSALQLYTTVLVTSDDHPSSYKFTGLSPGIKYFFRVNAYDESNRVDLNTIIRAQETNTPGAIEFSGVKNVTVPAGDSGYSTLVAHWDQASGDFNAYKVFAISEDDIAAFNAGSISPNNSSYFFGTITDIQQTKFTIPGLKKNKRYAVYVVACEAEAGTCDTKTTVPKGDTNPYVQKTTPKLATYTGVKDIAELSGQAGLTQANLSWDLPVSDGVCNGINIKKVTSFSPLVTKNLSTCPSADGDACISKDVNCNETGVTVASMKTGVQYCFMSTIYSETEETDTTNLNYECHTPKHTKPTFTGFPACSPVSPTELKVTWTNATDGLFSNYMLIYRKIDNTLPNDPKAWFDTFKSNFEAGSLSGTGFEYKILSDSTFDKTLSGLLPNSQYRVMVKAYMNNGSDHFYDDNTLTPSGCETEAITLSSNGIDNIMSIGAPAKDPSTTINNANIKISSNNATSYLTGSYGVLSEYEQTKHGFVFLKWSDPNISSSSSLQEILDVMPNSLGADEGFFIFKSTTVSPDFSLTSKTDYLNSISEGDPNWKLMNPGAGIKTALDNKKASFLDVLDDLDGRDDLSEAKVVHYAIKFKINGTYLDFKANEGDDFLIDIVLAPYNMSLQHRWIVNKKFCSNLGKSNLIDRSNHYRCPYNGMGSVLDGADSYFDIKGHTLTDVSNLNCNIKTNRIIHHDKVPGSSVYTHDLNECSVYFSTFTSDEPSLGYNTTRFHDYWIYSIGDDDGFSKSRGYYHIGGSNYEYKLAPTGISGNLFFRSSTNILNGYVFSWDTNKRTVFAIEDPSENKVFTEPARDGTFTELTAKFFSINTWKYHYASSFMNKDLYAVLVPDLVYSTTGYNSEYMGTGRAQALSDYLYNPTGHGFDKGLILNKEYSIFPKELTDELLGRKYNTKFPTGFGTEATVIGQGDYLTTNNFDDSNNERPVGNISASTANYLCQSHVINFSTPLKKYGAVRKRPLSARELMASKLPNIQHSISGVNDFLADEITSPIYLSGQALCETDASGEGTCYTDPSNVSSTAFGANNVASAYVANPLFSGNSQWPFFNFAASENKFADQSMYYNESNGKSFFWKLTDNTDSRNQNPATAPNSEHFGIPQYTDLKNSDGGRYVANYPINDLNLSLVLGQPLWCDYEAEAGLCNTDDKVKTVDLPALAVSHNKYYQTEVRKADLKTHQTSQVLPFAAYYAPKVYRGQYHFVHNYNGTTVAPDDIDTNFAVKWTPLEDTPDGDIQVRCAVKFYYDDSGRLKQVDGLDI